MIVLTQVDAGGDTGIPAAWMQQALLSGIEVWNTATNRCRVPRLALSDGIETRAWHKQDGRSLVSVVTPSDCKRDDPSSDLCGDQQTAARTAIYPQSAPGSARDGLMEEADIELNAVHFRWALDGGGTAANLRRAIHHELGHVLGLAHPCTYGATSASQLPNCNEPRFSTELMNPDAAIREVPISLAPSAGDINELCTLYGPREPSSPSTANHSARIERDWKVRALAWCLVLITATTFLVRYRRDRATQK